MYREGCGQATKVELKIEDKDGKAICARGGAVQNKTPNSLIFLFECVMNMKSDFLATAVPKSLSEQLFAGQNISGDCRKLVYQMTQN
jgi:hypothetical protein